MSKHQFFSYICTAYLFVLIFSFSTTIVSKPYSGPHFKHICITAPAFAEVDNQFHHNHYFRFLRSFLIIISSINSPASVFISFSVNGYSIRALIPRLSIKCTTFTVCRYKMLLFFADRYLTEFPVKCKMPLPIYYFVLLFLLQLI